MDPEVISNPHSGHWICLRSLTWYKSPTPVHFNTMASSNNLTCNVPGYHVIVCDLVTLDARPYLPKRPTRMFVA